VFLHASVSKKQVFAFAVKDTLAHYLFMRKKMLLSVLVQKDGVAPINSAFEFLLFEYSGKSSIDFANYIFLPTRRALLRSLQPRVDALSTV
jgi:hypothetical protein